MFTAWLKYVLLYLRLSSGLEAVKGVSAGWCGEQSMGEASPWSECDVAAVFTAGRWPRRRAAERGTGPAATFPAAVINPCHHMVSGMEGQVYDQKEGWMAQSPGFQDCNFVVNLVRPIHHWSGF